MERAVSLDTYVTLQEATQRYKLDAQLLTRLVTDGKIRGGKLNGTFVLSEKDTRRVANQQVSKEELRARVSHLEGRPIGVNEAARKYDLSAPNISTWIKAGYIRVLSSGHGRGFRKSVDESDVAYAKELTRMNPISQGKRVFTPEFIPDWF
jgi:predicted site-specific integrase-resolvase